MTIRCESLLKLIPITIGPENHFFGFHDVSQIDEKGEYALALRTKFIDRPPISSDLAEVVVVRLADRSVIVAGSTSAWNFPQGARQQWWPGRAGVFVYNRIDAERLVTVIYDIGKGELGTIAGGVYSISPNGRYLYTLDFRRLQWCGGYGYSFPKPYDALLGDCNSEGIWRFDSIQGGMKLLLSTAAVLRVAGEEKILEKSAYLTHVVPSPTGRNLCFLLRTNLADGGIGTRICVSDADGEHLRILCSGFYSHFTWLNDEKLVFWGRNADRRQNLRKSAGPKASAALRLARPIVRFVRKHLSVDLAGRANYQICDLNSNVRRPFERKFLKIDGHPTYSSTLGGVLVTDTYPDERGNRILAVLDVAGRFKKLVGVFGTPFMGERSVDGYLAEMGVSPTHAMGDAQWKFFNSRSGYSCDLHPRFDHRGLSVTFDSLHTGTRQCYQVHLEEFVNENLGNNRHAIL